ncbi:E3 SUMO-protein ligase ZBED1-like [Aethina tumida]|uniref:E3 SUMO-protein ligase ZBED1-like n=1 Tax=Aethina tumida TaxID=116153 RepID=UPI0021487017|nr:E3 SUMO-protein ligase ZBED1-like [Aethina tumida]
MSSSQSNQSVNAASTTQRSIHARESTDLVQHSLEGPEIHQGLEIPQSSVTSVPSTLTTTSTDSGIRRPTKQLRLMGSFKSSKELSESDIKDLNLAVIKMIVWDYQPLTIVEDPLYTFPSRKNLTTKLIPDLYESEVEKLQLKLSCVNYVGVTTDLWTSDSNKHYITVTTHIIVNAELHSIALQTSEVHDNQTGPKIASELREIFAKWNIDRKIITVVSDNGANVKSAINDNLRKHHHPCVAHTLNLSVKDGLTQNEELCTILDKCRRIVGHFKHRAQAVEKLTRMQLQMGLHVLKIKQDVATRWSSTYIMIKRLVEIKAPLTAVLSSLPKASQMLSAEEWLAIEDCVPLLKPFDLMTTTLSGEKYVTLSSIIPLLRGLQYSLNKINCVTEIGNKLKNDFHTNYLETIGQL